MRHRLRDSRNVFDNAHPRLSGAAARTFKQRSAIRSHRFALCELRISETWHPVRSVVDLASTARATAREVSHDFSRALRVRPSMGQCVLVAAIANSFGEIVCAPLR